MGVLIKHVFLAITLLVFSGSAYAAEFGRDTEKWETKCAKGNDKKVVVDIGEKAMCLGPDNCFRIGIGRPGTFTSNSPSGSLKGCQGGKYKDIDPGTKEYDKDCFATGTSNDHVGKWIHKPQGCHSTKGGPEVSLGCMLVPCSKWMELEEFVKNGGEGVEICGGDDRQHKEGDEKVNHDEDDEEYTKRLRDWQKTNNVEPLEDAPKEPTGPAVK